MTHRLRCTARALLSAAAVAAVAALASLPAEAQTITEPAASLTDVADVSILPSEADLSAMADALAEEAGTLSEDDPRRAETLRLAGRYYHHADDLESSRKLLVEAGLAYHRIGEHRLSAHAFLDASEVAAEAGDRGSALEAADMAGAVLRASGLNGKMRDQILSRVTYADREANSPVWPGRPDA